MKKDIHPTYHSKATVKCVCGAKHVIGSTIEHMDVEICGNCHPFYTGKQTLIDTAGRIERFKARKEKAAVKPSVKKPRVRKNKA